MTARTLFQTRGSNRRSLSCAKDQARALLADVHRVLKPGGTVRVCVPDLEYIVNRYLRGEREETIERYFFYSSSARNELSTRHYQYDCVMLRNLLEGEGYAHVRRCAPRDGLTPDLDRLDRLSNETLFVEARKPPVR